MTKRPTLPQVVDGVDDGVDLVRFFVGRTSEIVLSGEEAADGSRLRMGLAVDFQDRNLTEWHVWKNSSRFKTWNVIINRGNRGFLNFFLLSGRHSTNSLSGSKL